MHEERKMKFKELEKILLKDGWFLIDIKGSHYQYKHKNKKGKITIPMHRGDLALKTANSILRTEVVNDDFYAAVDLAIDKLEDQIRRQKTRLSKRHKEHLVQAFIDEIESEEENDIPVKTKSVTAEEMVLDEAIMQMELSGHSFYIYKDEDSQKIAVVYARHNGGYGLIEVDE